MMKVGSKVRVRLTSGFSWQRKFGVGTIVKISSSGSLPIEVYFAGGNRRVYDFTDLESTDFNDYIKAI